MTPRAKGDGSVFQLANGKWRGQVEAGFTASGARRYRTVTRDTRGGAVKALRALQNDIAKGQTSAAASTVTVKKWSDEWLPIYAKKVRPTRLSDVRGVVRKYIVPAIGGRRVAQLTPADVRAVQREVKKSGNGQATALRTHDALMVMLKAALVEGVHVPPAVFAVERPRLGENDRGAIPLSDALAILREASKRPDAVRWTAGMLQGMRQAECLGLTWACVDLDKGVVDVSWQLQRLPYADREAGTFRVPDGFTCKQLDGAAHLVRPKSKSGRRLVPLVPWMVEALRAWREVAPENPHGLVWAEDGRPKRKVTDRRDWQAIQSAAGVQHESGRLYVIHEMRHTTATLLLELGVDPHTVTAIMGHSSITTTRGYQTVNQALALRAMEQVAERLKLTAAK